MVVKVIHNIANTVAINLKTGFIKSDLIRLLIAFQQNYIALKNLCAVFVFKTRVLPYGFSVYNIVRTRLVVFFWVRNSNIITKFVVSSVILSFIIISLNPFTVNDASSDISIVRIDLVLLDGTIIKCKQREESFYTYINPDHYGPVARSIEFPINLTKMQGTYGVIRFDIPYRNKQMPISDVLIHTNRKTVCSRDFTLGLNLAISKLIEQIDSHNNGKNSSGDSESSERS